MERPGLSFAAVSFEAVAANTGSPSVRSPHHTRRDDPNERGTTMTDKTPDRIEQRSATTNAGLGILAASPFLHALAQAGKEKLTNRPPKPEPPKIIVPPSSNQD